MHANEKYHNCFGHTDNLRLKDLLREDANYWETISHRSLEIKLNFKEKIDKFFIKEAKKLEEILFDEALNNMRPKIQKLPILSSKHKKGRIDFEWPTDEDAKEMLLLKDDDVKVN